MKITVTVDDALYEKAIALRPGAEQTDLIHEAIETFVRVKSTEKLMALGGTMPEIDDAPIRR